MAFTAPVALASYCARSCTLGWPVPAMAAVTAARAGPGAAPGFSLISTMESSACPACDAQPAAANSLADLLRQIGHDERTHKQGSLVNMRTPRFAA